MKNARPYIIVLILLGIIAALVIFLPRLPDRTFDQRVTMKQKDKIPYGTAAARQELKMLFPSAHHYFDRKSPAHWDSIATYSYNQAVFLIAQDFNPDDIELRQLLDFVQRGNSVFIIARNFSSSASEFFGFGFNELSVDEFNDVPEDSLAVQLRKPRFDDSTVYVYPGKRYMGNFYKLDTLKTLVLGLGDMGHPNFLQFQSGSGSFFVHSSPLAFSNYFVLHKHNSNYFSEAVSVIPRNVENILWNEYYLDRPNYTGEKDHSIFRVLMKYPAFRWGLLTGLAALLAMVLLGSRRKQRRIPVIEKPHNDSLDFVKTIGRLYHDRGDHANLARKMAVYFLDHVRSVYQMPTSSLGPEFVSSLAYKSGFPAEQLEVLVSFIRSLDAQGEVSDEALVQFHKQLEKFYQNT